MQNEHIQIQSKKNTLSRQQTEDIFIERLARIFLWQIGVDDNQNQDKKVSYYEKSTKKVSKAV